MQVVRLEVFGFKSFMERLILPLEAGITGVVGPNGCGKSNTVDALRWVLGETRASNLRGGILEDVIFNGTDKLRPLGLAEVTLTLRADSTDFISDLVSPELEAQLVADQAALEDLDTDASQPEGADPECSNEQETHSHERPKLKIIEGTKVTEYGEGFEKAGDSTQLNLAETIKQNTNDPNQSAALTARFSWLKNVSEVQVTRRLYRSGESEFFINRVPTRLKDLKDFFRAVGLGARTYTIVAQGEVTRIISAKPEERRQILEEAAGVLGFRDKIASASRRLEEGVQNLARIEEVLKEITRQVNSLKIQASRARNRQGLKEQIHTLENSVFADTWLRLSKQAVETAKLKQSLELQENELSQELEQAQRTEQQMRNQLLQLDEQAADSRNKVEVLRELINSKANQRSREIAKINESKVLAQTRVTELKRLEDRRNIMCSRSKECQKEIADLLQQDLALSVKVQDLKIQAEDELPRIVEKLSHLRADLKGKEDAQRDLTEKLIRIQSQISSAKEQIISASPVNQLKRSTKGGDLAQLNELGADAKLFIEHIRVPENYLKALQAVLAERSAFLISDKSTTVARYFLKHLQSDENSKKERVGIGVFRAVVDAPAVSSTITNVFSSNPEIEPLLSVLKTSAEVKFIAQQLFQNIYVAKSAEVALVAYEKQWELAGQKAPSEQVLDTLIVTLEGDLVSAYSFFSLRHEGGLVQLTHRLDSLELEAEQLSEQNKTLTEECDGLQAEVSKVEIEQSRLLKESQAKQQSMRELSATQGNVRGRLEAANRLVEQVAGDLERCELQIRETQEKITLGEKEHELAISQFEALGPDDSQEQNHYLSQLKNEYESIENTRRTLHKQTNECFQKMQSLRSQIDSFRTKVNKCVLDSERQSSEKQHLSTRYQEDYGEQELLVLISSLDSGVESRELLDPTQLFEMKDELSKLRAKIQREGEVDYSSIERFEDENKRLEEIQVQREDILQAQATLRRTIERLQETSKARFLATFYAVKEHFGRLAPKLFGGGKAEIELLDPEHPLDSGLEIVARPPGKKLKSIELMSGGEKCLCATGLIFAMFLVRPSPLCVLDEVDAPLDEANLMRFLTLIKEMSKTTQFLVITHNKSTMAVADNLVGVTMQEPGASRIISVSLQDAYQQVA